MAGWVFRIDGLGRTCLPRTAAVVEDRCGMRFVK